MKIEDVINQLFPNGTRSYPRSKSSDYSLPPDFPPDLFAIACYLLKLSGAYQHFCCSTPTPSDAFALTIPRSRIEELSQTGRNWGDANVDNEKFAAAGLEVQRCWDTIFRSRDRQVSASYAPDGEVPAWWRAAYELMVIADEACEGVGYVAGASTTLTPARRASWVAMTLNASTLEAQSANKVEQAADQGEMHVSIPPGPTTICANVDRDIVCVQPKARTPSVGCTLPVQSQNIALIPPRGVMRTHWQRPPKTDLGHDADDLNFLIIPYPYTVSAPNTFYGQKFHDKDQPNGAKKCGWLEIKQSWLTGGGLATEVVTDLVNALVDEAEEKVGTGKVHGIAFPEYSLDWPTHKAVAESMRDREGSNVDLVISGSSSNCIGKTGNFVLSSQLLPLDHVDHNKRHIYTISRSKHHRWKIDKSQIDMYNLSGTLDGNYDWWERISITKRELHMQLFRNGSIFTTMICEDLARNEPCHEIVRSIGPNLVFVLLFDGPQTENRWPARYATVLADDPGCSVLTLTSRALLERSNQGRELPDWSVALWKESHGRPTPIICDPVHDAVLLRLSASVGEEVTMDGRVSSKSWAWRFKGAPIPLRLDRKKYDSFLPELGISV